MMWRLPFGGLGASQAPVSPDQRREFPALQQRFDDLDQALVPAFTAHDSSALTAQRTYRRFALLLVVGAALASFFGAVQAALGDDGRWAAVVVVVVGAATSYASRQLRHEHLPGRYLVERAKAEELRALYFEYLSGIGLGDSRELEARVADIRERKPGDPNAAYPDAMTGDPAGGPTVDPTAPYDDRADDDRADDAGADDAGDVGP